MLMLKKRLFTFSLLIVLCMAIVPLETFHSHHTPSIICLDSSQHLEVKHLECDLCDFILPIFESNSFSLHFSIINTPFLYFDQNITVSLNSQFALPLYRGPPQRA